MKKRVLSILVCVIILITTTVLFAGCSTPTTGSSSTTGSTTSAATTEPTIELQNYTIGVMLYDYTGLDGREIEKYTKYLEKEFGVTFILGASGFDDAANVTAVESLITQGCDAIISYAASPIKQMVEKCAENEVYFATFGTEVTQGLEDVKDNPYYAGAIAASSKDPAAQGKAAAAAAFAAGCKVFGATSFPGEIFPGPFAAAQAFLANGTAGGGTALPPLVHMFDNVQGEISNYMTSNPTVDTIYGAADGMNFVYPVIVSLGKTETIKFCSGGIGLTGTREAFEDGSLIYASTPSQSCFALSFAMLYNKLAGVAYPDAVSVENNYTYQIDMATVADFDLYEKYVVGDYVAGDAKPPITAETLKTVMVTFNKDATYADLLALADKTSLQDIADRNK